MSDLYYASEKFGSGVHILAVSPGRIHERLLDAYRSQVCRALPPWGDMPADLAARVDELHDRLTQAADQGDGTIAASIAALSEEEAVDVAGQIVALDYALSEELRDRRS